MKRYTGVVLSFMLVIGMSVDCLADNRSYVWTYEYQTMPKGMWELETYVTAEVPDLNKSNINAVKPWVELEYGITNNWDISFYNQWKFSNKANENDSRYEGFKVRTRYRFGHKGQFIVDPLIYLEYIRDAKLSKPNVIEAKLVVAKDIGLINVSYNQILKRNLENEGKTNHEYAAGVSLELARWLKLGLESKGNYSTTKFAIGPTLAFFAKRFWVSTGAAFGVNKRADDLQVRAIVGVPFN